MKYIVNETILYDSNCFCVKKVEDTILDNSKPPPPCLCKVGNAFPISLFQNRLLVPQREFPSLREGEVFLFAGKGDYVSFLEQPISLIITFSCGLVSKNVGFCLTR